MKKYPKNKKQKGIFIPGIYVQPDTTLIHNVIFRNVKCPICKEIRIFLNFDKSAFEKQNYVIAKCRKCDNYFALIIKSLEFGEIKTNEEI